jgi:predicted adenine nucleotide alpha hydrolase (AANH) superfamily ATPase
MNNRNYQKELDQILEKLDPTKEKPRLLLHSCCAPCSSYVLEYLHKYFQITVYFYNPNITIKNEYYKRVDEVKRLIVEMGLEDVDVIAEDYNAKIFLDMVNEYNYAEEKEGGLRCHECYRMRLMSTASLAAEKGYDYFTSTLSISPHKNARWLNELAEEAGTVYGVKSLPSDFKKKNGYKRSIELSAEYNLYRQDYCGCIYSKKEREEQR